eukprot:scaffold1717_cov117-Cylindrotheca_fusiformis.AAC.7
MFRSRVSQCCNRKNSDDSTAKSGATNLFVSFHCLALFRKLTPLGDRVLVKRAPKEVQTAAGIYLPTDSTKDPNEGNVVAVGPGERDVTGTLHPTSLKSGDKVLLPEYGGTKVKLGDEEEPTFGDAINAFASLKGFNKDYEKVYLLLLACKKSGMDNVLKTWKV